MRAPPNDPAQILEAARGTSELDASTEPTIPLFRARPNAKEFRAQLAELRGRVDHLGLLSAVEVEERTEKLRRESDDVTTHMVRERAQVGEAIKQETSKTRAQLRRSSRT